ncbi:MAG: S41 family peptidase [Crocinitomicaceae bacterium]|nr:S41 family peptidase [Crocinitomicaceae bacterium]
MGQIFEQLELNFVDDPQTGKIGKHAIDAMLKELDPYTVFYHESNIEDYRIMTTGQYGGIGSLIRKIGDYVCIVQPYEESPAVKGGLMAGDKIVSIENKSMINKSTDEVSTALKGPKGTTISIKVIRSSVGEIDLAITRDEIKIPDIPYHGIISDKIGYIKLNSFTNTAHQGVKNAFDALKSKGMDKLIFDLRGNGGGLLLEAIKIVNLFVDQNQLVVTTKGRVKSENKEYKTWMKPSDLKIPVVVLIDKGSASASEIVSGSLQDLDRAVVLGSTSYGKGLVQRTYDLKYGCKVKLTVAKYYTPSGRCVQRLEYYDNQNNNQTKEIPDSLIKKFKTKNNREVIDGRGIEPDITITYQKISPITKELIKKNLIFDFSTKYRLENDSITKIEDYHFSNADYELFKLFIKDRDFNYSNQSTIMLNKLIDQAKKDSLYSYLKVDLDNALLKSKPKKEKDLLTNKNEIVEFLENEIVSRYYFRKGKVINSFKYDDVVKEAISLFKDMQKFNEILGE